MNETTMQKMGAVTFENLMFVSESFARRFLQVPEDTVAERAKKFRQIIYRLIQENPGVVLDIREGIGEESPFWELKIYRRKEALVAEQRQGIPCEEGGV